jgi:prolyl 4-hydroxylase
LLHLYILLLSSLIFDLPPSFFIHCFGAQWTAPTYMVNVEDMRLRGAGSSIKRKIWDAARDTIQEWTGEELTDCSLYGIRVYTEGSVLATHVDRMPLVSSAILNVDQDVDEPWPIEVYAHDGKAYNVTMEPGDMVSNNFEDWPQ